MTILKFQGVVDDFDFKLDSDNFYSVGGRDIIREVNNADFSGPVTVAIADATFTGDLDCWEGSPGYSEYTPGDPAELSVGPHNILEILDRHKGQEVTLWIADEPINTLEDAT